MTEMKVLHGAVLSICSNIDEVNKCTSPKLTPTKSPINHSNFMMNPFKTEIRRHSLSSVQDSLKKLRLAMRPFGHGLAKLSKSHMGDGGSGEFNSPEDIEIDDFDKKTYRTITDPMYPVFNSAGAPISKCLFQDILDKQRKEIETVNDDEQVVPIADELNENYRIEGFDSEMKGSPVHCFTGTPNEKLSTAPNRVALSLPLKSLTLENDPKDIPISSANIFETPAHRKKLAGIQLTPLMTKLSILAGNDERSSGFSSWDTTPGVDMATPVDGTKMFRRRSSIKYEDVADISNDDATKSNEMQRCELYICGQQNMTMLLLLEESSANKHELVQAMVSFYIYFTLANLNIFYISMSMNNLSFISILFEAHSF